VHHVWFQRRPITSLKSKIKFNYVLIFGPYRAVNTFHVSYKNQSVNAVRRNTLFSQIHTKQLCGQNVDYLFALWQNSEMRLLDSLCVSVRPSSLNISAPTGRIFIKSDI